MSLVYTFIALYVAWIWVDYFRYIGGYSWKTIWLAAVALGLGAGSTFFVDWVDDWTLTPLGIKENGVWWNDLLYSIVGIGAVEELAKSLAFLLLYPVFRKWITQPIHVVAVFCTVALGFSALENVLYLRQYGSAILDGRAVLAAVGHMCDSILVAYGVVWVLFRQGKLKGLRLFLFFVFASISHGIYDFWLIWEPAEKFGIWLTLIYFFITISFFATIVNNSLNNNPDLDYRNGVDPYRVGTRLGLYYLGVFFLLFLLLSFELGVEEAGRMVNGSLLFSGFIILVTGVRVSRLQLIKGRWNKLRFEFPFMVNVGKMDYEWGSAWRLKVRGYPLNDVLVDQHLDSFFEITPLSKSRTVLHAPRWAFLEGKFFLRGDQPIYPVKVYLEAKNGPFVRYYLIRKTKGDMYVKDWPIMGLIKARGEEVGDLNGIELKEFLMLEWVVIRPVS